MNVIDDLTRPIEYLNEKQFDRLERNEERTRKLLRSTGVSKKETRRRIHRDIRNPIKRKSAASPYEALRATCILRGTVRRAGLTETGGITFTVSILQHRPPVGTLLEYNPENALRKWREAVKNLKNMGLNVVGLTMLEIDLCRPLHSAPFYESHLHGVIWGASAEQLKRAFVIRKLAKGALRNRPKKFVPLSDLNRYLGYLTKLEPWLHIQSKTSKKGNWPRSRLPDADAHEWRSFMSRYRVHELVRFHGIDDGNLGVDGVAELALQPAHLSRGGPKGGHGGPSGHRKRR